MRTLLGISAMAIALAFGSADPSLAGESAANTWYDSYGKSAFDRSVALQAAAEEERARSGGYGPSFSTTNVYGDVNSWTTNKAPVSTATSYNSVNSNSTTTSVAGSGNQLKITTDQWSGTSSQSAGSGVSTGRICSTGPCGQ